VTAHTLLNGLPDRGYRQGDESTARSVAICLGYFTAYFTGDQLRRSGLRSGPANGSAKGPQTGRDEIAAPSFVICVDC
jgi:hypothetical protein